MSSDARLTPIKVVLTGGPCAGKTTLAQALSRTGASLVAEAALQVIDALRDELGAEEEARWRRAHAVEFQRRIARLQVASEQMGVATGATRVVCDRGLPDGIAYLRHFGVTPPDDLWRLARDARYDAVFLLDTLSEFRPRPETGRLEDHEASLSLRHELSAVYRELGHAPILIPALPVEERVRRVESVWDGLLPVTEGA